MIDYDGRINPNSKNNIEFYVTCTKYNEVWDVCIIMQSRVKGNIPGNNFFQRIRRDIELPLSWSDEDVDRFMKANFTPAKTQSWGQTWGTPLWEFNNHEVYVIKSDIGWWSVNDIDMTEEQEWIINYILYSQEIDYLNLSIHTGKYINE